MRSNILKGISHLILLSSIINATIIRVPTDQPTIQAGLIAANEGDTVLVASGVYYENIVFNVNWNDDVSNNICLISEKGAEETIIDGGRNGSVIGFYSDNTDTASTVEGFTIQNGYSYYGGGIDIEHSSPTIIYNIIRDNEAFGFNYGRGAGIYLFSSEAIIKSNVIFNNVSETEGGGIYLWYSNAIIENNTIYRNKSINWFGGGIYSHNSYIDVKNSILWSNQCSNNEQYPEYSQIKFTNEMTVSYSDIEHGWSELYNIDGIPRPGEGNIKEYPLFIDTLNYDFHLQQGSPCIDSGDPDLDGDGLTWESDPDDQDPDGTQLDIGAYYFDQNVSYSQEASFLPLTFMLYQNYPNPFNPMTTIHYDLPKQSHVTLTIYDLLGRQVKILVNQTQDAGFKSIQWDASSVPSGIYFYQINAGNFTQTRKTVLLR